MKSASNDQVSRVRFIISGFGPFDNVSGNPSMELANKIVPYLQECEEKCIGDVPLSTVTETVVIETSVEEAKQTVDALYERIVTAAATSTETEKMTIVLHLGVAYSATQFHIEMCAYNEATFRIPDERGYQPEKEPIMECIAFGSLIHTSLDVDLLSRELNDVEATVKSIDPGRFVCNYTYCYSLYRLTTTGSCHCLFVHVPPFTVIPEARQLDYLRKLMQAISRQVATTPI